MKTILLLLSVVAIVGMSCDGRKTKKESLELAVSEFNLKSTPIPSISYHPESYTEVVTDTLIGNTTKVSIKNYALMNEQIETLPRPIDNVNTITYQRVFESDLHISTATKVIFSTHISAKQFKNISKDPFWDNATLQHVWVNQELSSIHTIQVDISFVNPKSLADKLYRMAIDTEGNQTLQLIEANI